MSPPSCPGVPSTRYFSAAHSEGGLRRPEEPRRTSELDARVVAEHEAHRSRTRRRLAHLALLADQRAVDLAGHVVDARALEHDAVLDLGIADHAVEVDGRE